MAATQYEAVLGSRAILSFEVGESWSVAQLASFLQAVEAIYDHYLAAIVAQPGDAEAEATPERREAVRAGTVGSDPGLWYRLNPIGGRPGWPFIIQVPPSSTGETLAVGGWTSPLPLGGLDLLRLVPDARLQVNKIVMASPGAISLQGLEEPIREVGRLIQRLSMLDVNRRTAKERLAAAKEANRHQQEMNLHQEEMNRLEEQASEIKLVRDQLALIGEYLEFAYGPTWRDIPEARAAKDDIVKQVALIRELSEAGKLVLPPGVTQAA
jgi:hypothetical protein